MEVFVYLFGYIILFCIIVAYTRRIKSRTKKYIVTILIFITSHFILAFEHFLGIFVTPIYCKLHSNEPVTVYTSSEEWKNKVALDIEIKQISGSPNSINPEDFNFYYLENLDFNDKKYNLFSVENKRPNIAIYNEPIPSNMFRKREYIYYDVIRNMVLIGKNSYYVFYESFLFPMDYIESCEDNLFNDLDEALNNYR